jgi:hypothetical protein
VISAVALGEGAEHDEPEWLRDVVGSVPGARGSDDDGYLVDLPPLPGQEVGSTVQLQGRSRFETRKKLRDANADSARALVRRTGLGHAHINAELNRMSGVERIADATLDQLERRLRFAERWLQKA